MIYLTGVSNELTRIAAQDRLYGRLGVLLGPKTFGGPRTKIDYSRHISDYCAWGLDNGCFSNAGEFDEVSWLRRLSWLIENVDNAHERCLFAAAPDVFDPLLRSGDMRQTIDRSLPVFCRIRDAGAPAALILQDGVNEMTLDAIPWDAFDVLFIGGSDDVKLGYPSDIRRSWYEYDRDSEETLKWAAVIARAHAEEKGVHLGRVSSALRVQFAREIRAESCDGTYLRHRGTERGLGDIDRWLRMETVLTEPTNPFPMWGYDTKLLY